MAQYREDPYNQFIGMPQQGRQAFPEQPFAFNQWQAQGPMYSQGQPNPFMPPGQQKPQGGPTPQMPRNITFGGQPGQPGGPALQGGNPFLNFLQSDGGSSLVSGVLNGFGQMGAARSQERMQGQQNQLTQQQLANQQQQFGLNDRLTRDQSLSQAAPTGWAQNYQQQTLLKNLMLQKLMSGSSGLTPANEAVAKRLQATGSPFKPELPDEWKTANPFGVDMTNQSLQQRQGVLDLLSGGRGPGMDMTAYGGDPAKAAAANHAMNQYRGHVNGQYEQSNPLQQALNAPGGIPQAPQGGGGVNWGKVASTGAALAPTIAGMFGGGGAAAAGAGAATGLAGILGPATMGASLAIPAIMAGYNRLQRGAHTNDQRDAFKAQFGDSQGTGLQRMVDSYDGPDRDQLMNSYNQFMTAGKPQDLHNGITGLQALLQQRAQQSRPRNPYL